MFILKLNTGKTFMIDNISENYRNTQEGVRLSLCMQTDDTNLSVIDYRNMLNEEGAMDKIQVLNEAGKLAYETDKFTKILDLQCVLMQDSTWRMTLTLLEKDESNDN